MKTGRSKIFLSGLIALLLLLSPAAFAKPHTAANSLLDAFNDTQKQAATYDYGSPERLKWNFFPLATRKGVPVNQMDDEQKAKLKALLKASLSPEGYETTIKTMALERFINADPQKYYITFFGTPGDTGTWGYSLEGHHMSINMVYDNGVLVSATPMFYGAIPLEITEANTDDPLLVGTRVFAAEEDLALKLLESLDNDQRGKAITTDEPEADMRENTRAQAEDLPPVGVPASEMNPYQKAILRDLIETYTGKLPEGFEKDFLAEIEALGFGNIHFSWTGAQDITKPHSYRVQGPGFVIILYNVQDALGKKANHMHCILRTRGGDFYMTEN